MEKVGAFAIHLLTASGAALALAAALGAARGNWQFVFWCLGIALIVGGIGVRRLRKDKGTALLKTTMAISFLLLAAYVVAIWAMAGKPD